MVALDPEPVLGGRQGKRSRKHIAHAHLEQTDVARLSVIAVASGAAFGRTIASLSTVV